MNTVIYYPNFYPTSDWLKVAALCWDKVYTLMPEGHNRSEFDPPAIQELDSIFGGILGSIDVATVGFQSEVREQFARWLDARAEELKTKGLALEEDSNEQKALTSLDIVQLDSQKFRHFYGPTMHDTPTILGMLTSRGLARIEAKTEKVSFYDMVPVEVHPDAFSGYYRPTRLIYLPRDIALNYLSLCASKVALEGKRDLVADGEQFTDIVFHDFRAIQGEVAASVIQAYLPKNFLTMDSKHLAEFRSEFATQRFKYEKEIQALVNEFADVASEGQLDVLKKRVIDIAKARIEETKKTYTRAKVEMLMSTFGISLTPPALGASIASLLGVGIIAPAGIAAALSLFAAKLLLDWKKAKSEKIKSPWSYVLDAAKMK